jgi:hypothetical protein
MRTLLVSLALLGIGCSESETNISNSGAECVTKYEENWIGVNDPGQEKAITVTKVDQLGCETVITTYYTMVNPVGGASGASLLYYAAQCQWDACGGPMMPIAAATDPGVDNSK